MLAALFWGIKHLQTRNLAQRMASDQAKQVLPVWAVQGPFSSGAESAAAMRMAWKAVFGEDKAEKMEETIQQHAVVFEAKPDEWEETRRTAIDIASPDVLALGEAVKNETIRQQAVAAILVLSENDQQAEKISAVVGDLFDLWRTPEMRQNLLFMLTIEGCYPLLEKLADHKRHSPEWLSIITQAAELAADEREKGG